MSRSKKNPNIFEDCTEKEACDLIKAGLPALITFDYENWTQQYSMYCDNSLAREQARSYFTLMTTIFCLINLIMTDRFGRITSFRFTFVVAASGLSLSLFGDSYNLKLLGLGIGNSCTSTFSSLYTIMMTECTGTPR